MYDSSPPFTRMKPYELRGRWVSESEDAGRAGKSLAGVKELRGFPFFNSNNILKS